jgi:hypothetical protein
LLLLLPPPITFFFIMSKIPILLSEWHWLLANSHMLRLLISRNPPLRTLQPKKKTLLNQAGYSPLSKHRSSLKPISRNTEMGFQYTQLETFSHSTSLENILNYEDGHVFAPAYWHPP